MRQIIIIFWAGLVFGLAFAVPKAPIWLEKNWPWVLGIYLLAFYLVCREHQKEQDMQALLARCAHLETTMLWLLFMHWDKKTFEAFLSEGRQNRSASPDEIDIRNARDEIDKFRHATKFLSRF